MIRTALTALFDIIDPAKTCFHVITKSGNTVETVTQFMLALRLLQDSIGDDYKDHIVITTDKEKGNIKRIADENGFKTVYRPGRRGRKILGAVSRGASVGGGAEYRH